MKRLAAMIVLTLTLWAQSPLPVVFTGNRHIPSERLYEVLGIPKPLFFEFWKSRPRMRPDRVQALLPALESYYQSHGYYKTRANFTVKDGKIVIHIQEGKPIHVADIAIVSPLKIRDIIPFRVGDLFDAETFVKSKEKILRFYRDHHYCNVQLDAKAFVQVTTGRAYLVYEVTPNRPCVFGKITVTAPDSVDPRIIRSLLMFREGDPYSAELIRLSYRDIYANEGVERVIIDDTTHRGNRVPVHVTVSVYPRPLHFSAGLGYNSDEGINLQMGVKHRNFLGNLKTVGLDARYSTIKQYVHLTTEMPLPNHNRLALRAGVKKEIFDGYDEYSVTGLVNLKHLRYPYFFQESVVADRIETRNSNDPVNFPNGRLLIVSGRVGWEVDRRDSVLDPTRGYRLEVRGMGSLKSFLSDATYYKIDTAASYHKPLPTGILAARVKLGSIDVMDGRIPPSYRYYAGGMNSNRGWNYRQLGPQNRYGNPIGAYSILESSIEYRHPLGENFRWVLFGDVTWLGQDPYPDFSRAYVAVGPGIRYLTPMGPIALDIGFDVNDPAQYAIHFHIGELF